MAFKSILTKIPLLSRRFRRPHSQTMSFWNPFSDFWTFYRNAATRYQVHSPYVAAFVEEVLEDGRWFYAFRDVERLRQAFQQRTGTLPNDLRPLVGQYVHTPAQGQLWFRTVLWQQPKAVIHIGAATGIGTLYLAKASDSTPVLAVEPHEGLARLIALHAQAFPAKNITVVSEAVGDALRTFLQNHTQSVLVVLDQLHTLTDLDACIQAFVQHASPNSVLMLNQVHTHTIARQAWQQCQQNPNIPLTFATWNTGMACLNPDVREKQHIDLVPAQQKPWKIL